MGDGVGKFKLGVGRRNYRGRQSSIVDIKDNNMKNKLLIILTFITIKSSFGQIHINLGVDTLDADVKYAIKFYTQYVNEFKDTTLPDFSKYFSAEDCKQYKVPDKMIFGMGGNNPIYKMGTPAIIYIQPKDSIIHIKTHFGFTDSLNNISTLFVTNHYIKFDKKNKPYFVTPFSITLKQWQNESNRNVTYYFPAYHKFNKAKSDSLIGNIIQLEKDWNLRPIQITYYFAETNDEIYNLRGFDYNVMMGNREKPSGMSDQNDNMVYCSGLGENYFHEIIHLYFYGMFQKSPLNEGLAVFYGGSMGRNLDWHLHRLNLYLKEHPEIDLNNPDNFYYMDNYTNPGSTIRALLCDLAFKKNGIAGLKKIMSHNSMDEILSKEFNVKNTELNNFYRTTIENY